MLGGVSRQGSLPFFSSPIFQGFRGKVAHSPIVDKIKNYDGNYTYGPGPKGEYRGRKTPFGSFKVSNAFGLYENAWECVGVV